MVRVTLNFNHIPNYFQSNFNNVYNDRYPVFGNTCVVFAQDWIWDIFVSGVSQMHTGPGQAIGGNDRGN